MPYLSVDDIIVGEKDGFATFTIRLDVASASEVTVNWATDTGTAGYGDFTDVSGTLTFAAGETVKTISIAIANDAVLETNESFRIELYSAVNATIAQSVGRATIIDNDAASGTPVVSISDFVIDEAAGEARFVITLNRPSTSTVAMNFATQNGSATAGADYVARSGSLSFAPGETAKTIVVALINDSVVEGSESFNLVLSNIVNATSLDPVGTAVIGANDGTPVAVPNISVDDVVVGEKDGFVDFVIRLDAPGTETVRVNWASDTRTAGYGDFVDDGGYVTFAPGETVKVVRIAITDDATAERAETFAMELYSPVNATIAKSIGTAIIIDNDAPSGTPLVSISDFVIDEAAGEASFVITLDRPSTAVVAMNYATQNGGALAGSDYLALSGSVSFGPGETAKTVKVALINDGVAEGSESFNLLLSNITNATSLDPVGTAIIGANDATPVAVPNISVDDVVVGEKDGFVDFVIRLDAPGTETVTVNWASDTRTAGYGDFVDDGGRLTFAPGETVKVVRIAISDDVAAERAETFAMELYSPSNATISKNIGTAIIIDNDAPSGTPVVSVSDFLIDEATAEASFIITLDRPSTSVVSMTYATQNGSALAGSDYRALSGSVSFAPGETAKTVKVALINDSVAEGSESFSLQLANIVNATSLDPVGTAVIGANDATPVAVPTISVDDVTVGEKDGFADFVIRLDAPATQAVEVRWASDTRTAGYGDFVDDGGYLTFAPGEVVKVVRIALSDDVAAERAETFAMEIYSPVNATIAKNIGIATIIDNDAASGTPLVSVSDFVIDEAAGEASFVITLDRPSTSVVSMSYATQNGSALAGSDYGALAGSVSFAPGETAKTVKVALINDSVAEGSESFSLILSNLINAAAQDVVGNAVIWANDASPAAVPRLSVSDVVVREGSSFAEFIVRLDAPGTDTVRVNWASDTGTAGYGDFVDDGGYLTFAPGEMVKLVRIALNDDINVENEETFALEIYSPVNAVIVRGVGTAVIVDNDGSAPPTTATLNGTTGDDVLAGGDLDETINGLDGQDMLFGNAGADTLVGGGGHDRIDGGTGADRMDGGAGDDIYFVDNLADNVIEAANAGNDTVYSSVTYNLASRQVETLILTGTGNIGGSGNALANTLTGNSGNNVLDGRAGADVMAGGLGNDIYYVDNLADNVIEAADAGNDTVYSSVTYNLASRQVETLILTGTGNIGGSGNALANTLTGNSGNNVLDGRAGADVMAGGLGNDIYYVDNLADNVIEAANAGNDTVYSSVTYNLASRQVETLILTGAGNIAGSGNALANMLTGNSGNNMLDGGAGSDMLTGGLGQDQFRFSSALGVGNIDTITDFNVAADTIALARTIFASAGPAGVLNANAFHIGAAAADASDRIVYNSATGALLYDADGNGGGAAVQFAQVAAGLAMTSADFLLV